MATREDMREPLMAYALELERENKRLRQVIEQERAENARLRGLRMKDRETAARYRAIAEGDVA